MKNVREYQLKKCIFMDYDMFKREANMIFGNNVVVECDYEGISIDCDGDILEKLSEYYGVEVTSIHIDDCEVIGVWIAYR